MNVENKKRVACCVLRELQTNSFTERGPRRANSAWVIRHSKFTRAFTLIELMVVVGIIGMVLAMGAPTLYHFLHKEGFRKSVGNMMDACSTARARAILSQTTAELVFRPLQRSCEVSGGVGGGPGRRAVKGTSWWAAAVHSTRRRS